MWDDERGGDHDLYLLQVGLPMLQGRVAGSNALKARGGG